MEPHTEHRGHPAKGPQAARLPMAGASAAAAPTSLACPGPAGFGQPDPDPGGRGRPRPGKADWQTELSSSERLSEFTRGSPGPHSVAAWSQPPNFGFPRFSPDLTALSATGQATKVPRPTWHHGTEQWSLRTFPGRFSCTMAAVGEVSECHYGALRINILFTGITCPWELRCPRSHDPACSLLC